MKSRTPGRVLYLFAVLIAIGCNDGPANEVVAPVPEPTPEPTLVRTSASVMTHPPEFALVVGNAAPLSVTVLDLEGNEIPDAVVTYTSDNEQVATVDASGLVTAASLGTASITATSGDVSATSLLTVTTFMPVDLSPTRATIPVGGRIQMIATQIDEAGEVTCRNLPPMDCLPAALILWSPDDVVSISRESVVTGLRKGKATIYANLNPAFDHPPVEERGWAVVTVE